MRCLRGLPTCALGSMHYEAPHRPVSGAQTQSAFNSPRGLNRAHIDHWRYRVDWPGAVQPLGSAGP